MSQFAFFIPNFGGGGGGGGGGGSPGGTSTNVQYNNSGAFGGLTGSNVDAANGYLGLDVATPLAPLHAGTVATTVAAPTGSTAVIGTNFAASPAYGYGNGDLEYQISSFKVVGPDTVYSATFDDVVFHEPDYTVYDVIAGSATIDYSGTGYIADGESFVYSIWAIYPNSQISIDEFDTAEVDDDSSGNPYSVNVSWTAPTGSGGTGTYLIFSQTGPNGGLYRVVTGTSFVDDNTGWGSSPGYTGIQYTVSISTTLPSGASGYYYNATQTNYITSTLSTVVDNGRNFISPPLLLLPTALYTKSIIADGRASFVNGAINFGNLGDLSAYTLTQTQPEIWIGPNAGGGILVSMAAESIMIGDSAGYLSTVDFTDNVIIGNRAGYNITGSSDNESIMIGAGAGRSSVGTGGGVVFIGTEAGADCHSSTALFIGQNAGANAVSDGGVFFGPSAGANSTSNSALFIGNSSGFGSMSANAVGIGDSAGQSSVSTGGIFIGGNSGLNYSGDHSSAIGFNAGKNGGGSSTILIGFSAGASATADLGIFIGDTAGSSSSGGDQAIFIGHNAGFSSDGSGGAIFLGAFAGSETTAPGAIMIGPGAGTDAFNAGNSIFIGQNSGSVDTVDNNSNPGDWSIAIGPNGGTGGFSNSMAFGRGVINTASLEANFGNVLYIEGIYNTDTPDGTPITTGAVVTSSPIKPNGPLTNINGSVSGTAKWTMPFQGATYKKFVIHYAAFHDTGTHTVTFPTAFVNTPFIYGDSTAVAISSASTTTFSIAVAATITGNVFVEGY